MTYEHIDYLLEWKTHRLNWIYNQSYSTCIYDESLRLKLLKKYVRLNKAHEINTEGWR